MHPSQVTQAHIDKYGPPTIKEFAFPGTKLAIVNFPLTPSRAMLAKEFGAAAALLNKAAQDMAEDAIKQHGSVDAVPVAVWDKIGLADNLPANEPIPAGIAKNIAQNKEAVDFPNLVWDQTTADIVVTTLGRIHDTNVLSRQPNAYTLVEGAPGTSKSKCSRIIAAVLERPVYNLNAEQVSPENLQAKIVGETTVVGNPSHCAKDMAYKGALTSPHARREVIHLLGSKRHEAITANEWASVASKEGLEKGSLYTVPGIAPLAKRYGGLFNIEELNCLRGDGFTLLTVNVLDVYDQDSPNFYVMSNMNPATQKHHNRTPLPVEISDRYGQALPVRSLNKDELAAVLKCNFTGVQPEVTVNNQKVRLNSTHFGIPATSVEPSLKVLSSILNGQSLNTLVDRVTEFHKMMETGIADGHLDKATSAVPNVQDFSILTRRGLSLFVQGMVANILSSQYKNHPLSGQTLNTPLAQDYGNITPQDVVSSVSSALTAYYVEPYKFTIDKARLDGAMNTSGRTGVIAPNQTASTEELIRNYIVRSKLTPADLLPSIQTIQNVTRTKDQFGQRLLSEGRIPTDLLESVLALPELKPVFEHMSHLEPAERNELLVISSNGTAAKVPKNAGSLMIVKPVITTPSEAKKKLPFIVPSNSGSGMARVNAEAMAQFAGFANKPPAFSRVPATSVIFNYELLKAIAPAIVASHTKPNIVTLLLLDNDTIETDPKHPSTKGMSINFASAELLQTIPGLEGATNPLPMEPKLRSFKESIKFDVDMDTPGTTILGNACFATVPPNQVEFAALELATVEIPLARLQELASRLSKVKQAAIYAARPELVPSLNKNLPSR